MHPFSFLKTLLLLSLLLPNIVQADDWNAGTGGKPSRNGLSSERGPLTPTLLWQGGLPAVIAQPAVIEENVLAMSRIQNISDVLHGTLLVAHDLETGDTLWTRDLPVDFPSTDWRNRVTAIRNGRVYATRAGNDNYSFLYALNATTGAILWRSQDSISENSTESPSFATNGDLIVGSFRNVERINATNGQRMWRTSRVSPTSNGNEAAVFGSRVYLWEASPQGPKVSAFNLTTGAYLYSSPPIGGGFVQQLGLFVGPNGTVYAPRSQNNVATDFLVAFTDIDTALIEKWRVTLGYVPFASFGIGPDGSVYSYTREKRIIRINPQSGSITDSSEIIESDFFQPRMAVDSSGIIYVTNGGFSQGALYSFNPNLTTRWSTPIASVNIGGPAIGRNGTMVVCGIGTDVRAYRGAPTGVNDAGRTLAADMPFLDQNYPNPFNPTTRIRFRTSTPGLVTIKLYDALGRDVTMLVSEDLVAGRYERTFDATGLASGVYLYRLTIGGFQQTRRLIVVK
jgi:outer membrane protein assembly factor BamB